MACVSVELGGGEGGERSQKMTRDEDGGGLHQRLIKGPEGGEP